MVTTNRKTVINIVITIFFENRIQFPPFGSDDGNAIVSL